MIPRMCDGVPPKILNPRDAVDNRSQYESRARRLADNFKANFKQFEGDVPADVLKAMP
jgi:phosphoenolpyruvate carboxykinase (ATP)